MPGAALCDSQRPLGPANRLAVTLVRMVGMMRLGTLFLALVGSVGSLPPLLAHHSFSAEFDGDKPIKVTGTVTRVEWQNPHIWFYVDVKNADGSTTNWAFSGGAPGQLMRRGVTKNVLKIGSSLMVDGFLAKDGSHNAFGSRVTFPDGKSVFTAGAEDRGKQ